MEKIIRRQYRHWLVGLAGLAVLTLSLATTQAQVRFPTVADMVAATIPAGTSGQQAIVAGRVTANDNEGGIFIYDSSSVASTNLYTILKPNSSNGRWLKQIGIWWISTNNSLAVNVSDSGPTFRRWSSGQVLMSLFRTDEFVAPASIGLIQFEGTSSGGTYRGAAIEGVGTDQTAGQEDAYLAFWTRNNGSSLDRMMLSSSGALVVANQATGVTPGGIMEVRSPVGDNLFYTAPRFWSQAATGNTNHVALNLHVNNASTSVGNAIAFSHLNSVSTNAEIARINSLITGTVNTTESGDLQFLTKGGGTMTEAARFVSDGTFKSSGNISLAVAGKGLLVKEGSNARMGTATLDGGSPGTVTVANTSVTANTRIFLTGNADGGTPGWVRVSARVAATSFTITSSANGDTSTVAWLLIEPSP